MKTLERSIATLQVSRPIREERLDGQRYLVAPVVAIMEGVHVGSGGALYYPPEELAKYVEAWNGVPLPVYHPKEYGKAISANTPVVIEERVVGNLYNVYFDPDGAKIKGELWINIEKAERIAPGILSLIRGGRPLDVSTSFWSDDEWTSGTWNGEEFDGIVRNIRPDHLALLPGEEGACSWADGCGVRANEHSNKGEAMDQNIRDAARTPSFDGTETTSWAPEANSFRGKLKVLFQQIGNALGLKSQELSHEELRTKLQRQLDALDNEGWIHLVRDIYDGFFIYEARGNNPSEIGQAYASKLYKRSYSIDNEENITLTDDAQEVREERQYVPIGNSPCASEKKGKEKIVNKKEELIKALINCDRTKFTDEDEKWLKSLEEEQLEKMGVAETETPPETPAETPPKPEEPKKEEVPEPKNENKAVTIEEFISNAPPEIKSVLNRAVTRDRRIKADLVKALLENKRNKFSEEELKAKDIEELEHLTDLAAIEVDFSGQGGGPEVTTDNAVPPMPPVFELKTGATK